MLLGSSGFSESMRTVFRRPDCDCCGKSQGELYIIDSFGGMHVCSFCVDAVMNYLARHELLDSNIFAETLLDGGDGNSTKSHYHLWIPRLDQPGTFKGTLVSRVNK